MTRTRLNGEGDVWFVDDTGAPEHYKLPSPEELNQVATSFKRIRKSKIRQQLILLIEEILTDQDRAQASVATSIIAKSDR